MRRMRRSGLRSRWASSMASWLRRCPLATRLKRMIRGVGQLALLTRDAERAAKFYGATLGLTHLYTFDRVVFFDCGGTRLFIRQVADDEWQPTLLYYLRVDDINV